MGRAIEGAPTIAPRLPGPVSANDASTESTSAIAPRDATSVRYDVYDMVPLRNPSFPPKPTLGPAVRYRKRRVNRWLRSVLNGKPRSGSALIASQVGDNGQGQDRPPAHHGACQRQPQAVVKALAGAAAQRSLCRAGKA